MDNAVIWVALMGVIGTLGGVYLGNWLQNRNIKQQREWLLHDQKSEWIRKQKKEDFEHILNYIENSITFLALIGDTFKYMSPVKQQELFVEFKKQVGSIVPVVEGLGKDEEELKQLVNKFIQERDKILKIVSETKDASKGNATDVIKVAGQIKKQINDSLAETFD